MTARETHYFIRLRKKTLKVKSWRVINIKTLSNFRDVKMGNVQLLESMKYNLSYPSNISETWNLLREGGMFH